MIRCSSGGASVTVSRTGFGSMLGQQVAGLTAFAYVANTVYAEFGGYRASPIGAVQPLTADSNVTGVVRGVAPYWRVAFTKGWGNNLLMVGTYGMAERQYPGGGAPLVGITDGFLDVAADAQFMHTMGNNSLTLAATWIYEKQHLDATFAAGGADFASHSLNTLRARATYHVGQRYGFTLAPFAVIGEHDATLYAPAEVTGSASGKPNSSGLIAEADFMPWQNVRLSAQYTMYGKFNGGTTNSIGCIAIAPSNENIVWVGTGDATNAETVVQYRAGKMQTFGFLVGQVMKGTKGRANPKLVNDLLRRELGS